MIRKYQLIVMGPEAAVKFPDLFSKLREDFSTLGLDISRDLTVITKEAPASLELRSIVAAVWFGSAADVTETALLNDLLSSGVPVLPLVDSTNDYSTKVPTKLHPINARSWSDRRVPGDVLRLLSLTRRQRQAFISYRRIESSSIAKQIFDGLVGRGYQVFLDTASVDAAETFQDVLWRRMADIDLIVLLDSPQGLSSRWVREELVRAQHLGVGVLRLTWPKANDDNIPSPGTEFCIGYDLKKRHFESRNTGHDGTLTATTLEEILGHVEDVRIESLALRRRRILSELSDRAHKHGLRIDLQPAGPITISKTGATPEYDLVAVAIPLIGLPDAWAVYDEETLTHTLSVEQQWDQQLVQKLIGRNDIRVLFDSLGIDRRWSTHLEWLNQHLKLQTVGFDRKQPNMPDPLDQWLTDLAGRQTQ